jgi:mono/diheme cytochrome c family protein
MLMPLFQPLFKHSKRLLLLAPLLWVVYCFSLPELQPVIINTQHKATVWHPPSPIQLGTLQTDSTTQARVFIRNDGFTPLLLKRVVASCGCTVPTLKQTKLNPAEHTWIDITIDTSLKLGAMEKTLTLYTNDTQHPVTELKLIATVLAAPANRQLGSVHAGINPKNRLALFEGSCKTCHVDRGVGKSGQSLFIADCGMCHGASGDGGVAPALTQADYTNPMVRERYKEIIQNGSPNNPSMPPFSSKQGGPLSDDQIESLLNYLAYQASLKQP